MDPTPSIHLGLCDHLVPARSGLSLRFESSGEVTDFWISSDQVHVFRVSAREKAAAGAKATAH